MPTDDLDLHLRVMARSGASSKEMADVVKEHYRPEVEAARAAIRAAHDTVPSARPVMPRHTDRLGAEACRKLEAVLVEALGENRGGHDPGDEDRSGR